MNTDKEKNITPEETETKPAGKAVSEAVSEAVTEESPSGNTEETGVKKEKTAVSKTESEKEDNGEKKDRWFSLKLFAVIALAFGAACLMRPSCGIFSMMSFMSIICLFSAFIKISPAIKLTVFPVMVFALNSVEHGDIKKSLLYAAICLLNCFLFEFSVKRLSKSRKQGIIFGVLSLVLCVCLNILFIGNPVRAHKADLKIREYTDKYYPGQTEGEKSGFSVSPIRFDLKTHCYAVDISDRKYPNDRALITVNGDYVNDGFKSILMFNLMEDNRIKITEALRSAFPDAKFTVTQKDIARFPLRIVGGKDDPSLLEKRMTFEINIGHIQLAEEFSEYAKDFIDEIDRAGISYAGIIFTGGNGLWSQYRAEVSSMHFDYRAEIKPVLRFRGDDIIMSMIPDIINR